MSTGVNLQELAVQRTPARTVKRPRPSIVRALVPLLILAGFAGVVAWSFRDSLVSATPVTVVPVITLRAEVQAADTPLFRAAGWIEPRPTPVVVSSLIDGIVQKVLVIEGQDVKEGEPVAELVRADAEIGLRQAKADLALQRSSEGAAAAQLSAAETYVQEPIERIAALASAESELAKLDSALSRMPSMAQAADARLAQARREFDGKTRAGDAVPEIARRKAESEVAVAEAGVAEIAPQRKALENERTALVTRRDTLKRQLDLRIEEKRQLAEAKAAVAAATANVEAAQARLAAAELLLGRTTIRSPITGKVLALEARPGRKLMGLNPAAMQDASTIVTMYDPAMLQVRADVRLENVPQVLPGQKVEIATPAVTGVTTGHVVAITSLTDIQKNTLQIKVAIDKPSPVLKPDMLVEAVFLAPPVAVTKGVEPPLRLVIPRNLVDTNTQEPTAWIADRQTRTARRRVLTLGAAIGPDLVEVTAGLNVGDRVIASGRELMQDRMRISIREESSATAMKLEGSR
jgi:multidrug efflux pump subunit AcrA (membrane-fusion protein)